MAMSIHKAPLPPVKQAKLRDEIKYVKNQNGTVTRQIIGGSGPSDIASHKRIYAQEKANKEKYAQTVKTGLQTAPLPYPWSIEGLYELDDVEWREGTRRVPTVIHLGYETSMKYDEAGSQPDNKGDTSSVVGLQRSCKSWPFISRKNRSQMKKPQSAQYVMCGRNLTSSLPRWIAEELTTDECSMDVRIARQRGEDIKLSSKSSSSSGKSTPGTKMKNQKETIYTHELDENATSLEPCVKLGLLSTITTAMHLIKSAKKEQHRIALVGLVEQLIKEELKPENKSRCKTASNVPGAVNKWQKPVDQLTALLREFELSRVDRKPRGFKELPPHRKQHCFLTLDQRQSNQDIKLDSSDQGTKPKMLACEIRKNVVEESQRPQMQYAHHSLVSEEPQTRGICGEFYGGVRRETSMFNQIYDKTPTDLLSAYLTKWNESVRLNRAEDLMLQPNHNCRASKRKLGTLRSRK